jgi:hypothetical protein
LTSRAGGVEQLPREEANDRLFSDADHATRVFASHPVLWSTVGVCDSDTR